MIKRKYLSPVLIGLLILSILLWLGYKHLDKFTASEETIHIALVGPMDNYGKYFKQAIDLHREIINSKGGINGKKIILDTFDDKNDPDQAEKIAQEIAEKNQAVAVIGHYTSTCSIRGGAVYKTQGIPAVTPGSTSPDVTINNEWYFRTIFNDNLQGRLLAHYLNKVLHQNTVSIIHEKKEGSYGHYLAKIFKQTSADLGTKVSYIYDFDSKDKNVDQRLQEIVSELKTKNDAGFIFLAAQATDGAKIVKLLRDEDVRNSVIVPAAFGVKSFYIDSFAKYPLEKQNPGYYTDGIYISSPLIYDIANEKAQQFKEDYKNKYQEEPDERAPFAYDTFMLLVEAIKETNIQGKPETLKEDRKKIRDHLASINEKSRAIEGITGLNYFDQNRDAQKPVAIGMFKNGAIISALVQLQDVRNPREIVNLEGAIQAGRVLKIDSEHMYYTTNVVYVGVKINEISDFDTKTLSYKLDFDIWFRFRGDIQPENVEFLNASELVILEKPSEHIKEKSVSSRLLQWTRTDSEDTEEMDYRLYSSVKGLFKVDFLPTQFTFKQHIMGFNFRHRELTRNNLIFVTDMIGMGLAETALTSQKELTAQREATKQDEERTQSKKVLNPSSGWAIEGASRFFQDTIKENSLGNPKHLKVRSGKVEYSRFNVRILVVNTDFTLRRTLSLESSNNLLAFSGIIFLLLTVASKNDRLKYFLKAIWVLQAIFAFLALWAGEVVVINWLEDQISAVWLDVIVRIFDILWWMIPAILLHMAVEIFLWRPLEEKSGRKIPRIGRRFVSFTIYLLALFAIVAFVYDQRLTSLLATSGVIAMIIGLAIQINISNIFSGIAINVEHPFRVGDWVQIGKFDEGKVVDITWRTTRILTRMGCILSIPNSVASESPIHNYDYPDNTFWIKFTIHIHPSHHPDRVRKIIRDAVISTDVVLKTPEPFIIFTGLTEWAADYIVYFVVRDYTWRLLHEEAVWTRIWIHLNRAGIAPAIQRQEIHMFKGVSERGEAAKEPLTLLREVDIFHPFSEEAKIYLSEHMHSHRFPQGEVIVRQGDVGESLFILVEGVVGVRIQSKEGEQIEVARLGAGNFFGEMALLTGEERTATVIALTDTYLFEITKEDIAGLMAEQPEVSELISKILTQRQMATKSQMNVQHDVKIEEDAVYRKLLDKIEGVFGLKGSPKK